MTVSRPATARELGALLKAQRNAAKLTLRALEQRTGISNAKISMWENGHRLPSLEDLDEVLNALGVTGDERERLVGMRREAEGPGILVAGAPTIGVQLAKLIEQEQIARRITEIAPLLVPGLLQTGDYARALFGRLPDTDTRVALRMGRREVLTRARNPVEFHALVDDEVLVRHVAPPPVMAEQLRYLLTMAQRPNITIQLVSSTQAGYTPLLAGPFILLEFATATPIVHLEHHSASASLWDEDDVRNFATAAEEIADKAMAPERSYDVIEELVKGMETT